MGVRARAVQGVWHVHACAMPCGTTTSCVVHNPQCMHDARPALQDLPPCSSMT